MANSLLRRAALLFLITGLASSALWQSAAAGPAQDHGDIVSSESCFRAPYNNFDSWLDHAQESEPKSLVSVVEKRIGRERFDHALESLICERFRYRVDGITVEAYSIRPSSSGNTKLPVVIYNRGGNASYGRIEFHALFQRLFPLAEKGFFVLASQYRGSEPDETNVNGGQDEFGGSDVNDVMALFSLIDRSPFADKDRIGMLGWSRGAIMSFLAATKTDRLSALIVGGAPSDLEKGLQARPEMEQVFAARIPNYVTDKEAALASRSVLRWADRLPKSLPILVLHGASDNRVALDSALDLANELKNQEIPFRLVVYENGNHSLLNHRVSVNQEIVNWLNANLGN